MNTIENAKFQTHVIDALIRDYEEKMTNSVFILKEQNKIMADKLDKIEEDRCALVKRANVAEKALKTTLCNIACEGCPDRAEGCDVNLDRYCNADALVLTALNTAKKGIE